MKRTAILGALALIPTIAAAQAQDPHSAMANAMNASGQTMQSDTGMMTMADHNMGGMDTVGTAAPAQMNMMAMSGGSGVMATLPGQDAFGAIQEITQILSADPATDWTKVNISALRDHLVDMNRLVLNTEVSQQNIPGGFSATVTGQGRTLAAIHRMVPAHAAVIDGVNGWRIAAEIQPEGAILTVTSQDVADVDRIRGLGFFGIMVTDAHHQPHHMALAQGMGMNGQASPMGQ